MKINVEVGKPRVSYRETISRKVEYVRGKHVKQSGGRGQFGDVTIHLEPYTPEQAKADEVEMEEGVVVENKIVGARSPRSI